MSAQEVGCVVDGDGVWSRFQLESLMRVVLHGLEECMRAGRDLSRSLARGFKYVVNFIGSKILNLIECPVFWNYAKFVPLVNTVFGCARALRHLYLGDRLQSAKSLLWGLGGLAAIFAPLYLGIASMWSFLLGSTFNNLIGGVGALAIDLWNSQALRTANWTDLESELYEKVIRVTPLLAASFCPIRAVFCLLKGNRRDAAASLKDLLVAGVAISLGYLLIQIVNLDGLSTGINSSIDEVLSNGPNAFVRVVLNCIKKFIGSGGPEQVIAQSGSQILGQAISDAKLLVEQEFPFYLPDENAFIKTLSSPHLYIKGDYNDEFMRKNLIEFVVRCLLHGYAEIKDGEDRCTVEMAFNGTFVWVSEYRITYQEPVIYRPPNPRPLSKVAGKPKRILCIDGGGSRGILSLDILHELEKKLGGSRISENFDYIFGTGSGGLITLLLADLPNRSVREVRPLYFKLKNRVFSGRRSNLSELENLTKEFFGDRLMGSIPTSTRVVITATVLTEQGELERKFFTNFHDKTKGLKINAVAICATAAPNYYPGIEDGVVGPDGGLTCNDKAFGAFLNNQFTMENSIFVSVGTGRYVEVKTDPHSNQSNPAHSIPEALRMFVHKTINNLANLFIDQVTTTDATDESIIADAVLMCQQSKAYFYRLNPILSEPVALDEVSDIKLANAVWQTKVFLANNPELIPEIAQRLEFLDL